MTIVAALVSLLRAHAPEGGGLGVEENVTLASGFVRSNPEGKVNYLLVRDGPMHERWARHMTKNAASKGERNWMNAHTEADLKRCRESFARHVEQWLDGDTDEDHAAAIICNLDFAEYIKERLG